MRELDKDSRISFKAPDRLMSKSLSASAMPANRNACYGVRVSGPNIVGPAPSTCDTSPGISAGFVASGKQIELLVPRGDSRTFTLYLFLQKEGATEPCPQMGTHFTAQFDQIYNVGSAKDVALTKPEQEIVIEAEFTGLQNHLAAQLNLSAQCLANAAPVPAIPGNPLFQVSAGNQVMVGSGMRLLSRSGRVSDGIELSSGSGIKLKARVK